MNLPPSTRSFSGLRPEWGNATLSRRALLGRGARLAAGLGAFGWLAASEAGAAPMWRVGRPIGSGQAGQVLVRTPGGAYEDAWRKAAWEPFAAETGIQIVPIATNAAKIQAMVESGNIELDILDSGELVALILQRRGALERLDTGRFTRTNLADIDPVNEYYTGNIVYATVLGYNTEVFASGHPTSWREFWDVGRFPGPRTLEDAAAEFPNLEQALLADGVAMDQLYPLDLDRAFKSLSEIRRSVIKWWDSGAVAAQLLADKQAVLGSIWNGRIQVPIDQGAPLAIEWNQAQQIRQTIAMLKGAPNLDNAYKYMDYVLTPQVQARFAALIPYGPANRKAFEYIDARVAAQLPTAPDKVKNTFVTNMQWWLENQQRVSDRWQEFLIGG